MGDRSIYFPRVVLGMKVKAAFFLLGLFVLAPEICPQETGTAGRRPAADTIPETLRRPERSEAPRYPIDIVIGELGRGEAPDGAYQFAKDLLSALTAGTKDAQVLQDTGGIITESLREEIDSIEPRAYRLGGGRIEPDGCVSFLVRFLGQELSISGELFLRRAEQASPKGTDLQSSVDSQGPLDPEGSAEDFPASLENEVVPEPIVSSAAGSGGEKWLLDDLILEETRILSEIRDSYRYDFSPYERFY